jgi:hypothetical protein
MPSLRSIANQYHEHANKLAARADRVGELTNNQRIAIESYRAAAAKIEALIRPEDSLPQEEETISIEGKTEVQVKKSKAHKAATPQELLAKAEEQ